MVEDLVQLLIENRSSTATLSGLFFGFASFALGVWVILRKPPQGDSNFEVSIHNFKISMSSKMPGVIICALGTIIMVSALQTGKMKIDYRPTHPFPTPTGTDHDNDSRSGDGPIIIETSYNPQSGSLGDPCFSAVMPTPEHYGFPDRTDLEGKITVIFTSTRNPGRPGVTVHWLDRAAMHLIARPESGDIYVMPAEQFDDLDTAMEIYLTDEAPLEAQTMNDTDKIQTQRDVKMPHWLDPGFSSRHSERTKNAQLPCDFRLPTI